MLDLSPNLVMLIGMILILIRTLYLFCAGLLALYAAGTLVLLWIYWRRGRRVSTPPRVEDWPHVAVQLPVYNERHVVTGLLDAVAQLDYPRDLLLVQVLDDSTDETTAVIEQKLHVLRQSGLEIEHIRRAERSGYKAGALAYGLESLDCEFVVVLDADFRPAPDFLQRMLPYLVADESLGMVQARWGHLNAFDNAVTLGQMLALDGHFVVEQTARNHAGWLINFSGSAGIWRVACIQAAGGWQAVTLTEDLDLSYRAQLAGWRFRYLPDVVVPAEIPPQIAAYKQQQARWAQGSTQTLRRMLRPLWRSQLTFGQRLMATLHLSQYLPHPLMLMLLVLTPPLMLAHQLREVPLGPLGLVGLGPPLLYVVSQHALYPDWWRRLRAFPVLLALGTGIAWNNSQAVARGLFSDSSIFFRTPKFAHDWSGSDYALSLDRGIWGEILLALYALGGAVLAWRENPALLPYLLLYSFAFGFIALWTLRDAWLIMQQRHWGKASHAGEESR